ncbi:sulfotransferase [Sphingobium sp. Sx8-8]|uniref:sulfotransferase family protein n=1 Tax=Sphingobium sp. Sx8-8 TaxID=2933617 RepID=UPI001F585E0E|nr:sulfotransferase [Sphingobium sp. Sx8-8]
MTMTPELDPAALKAEASRRTGLTDFGAPDFEEPLAIVCRSLTEEAPLSADGRKAAAERTISGLIERLKLQQWFGLHPEIADEEIRAPLVIAGLPRTGTTLLYRMLSAAEGFAAPLFYEVSQPAPAPDWNFDPEDDRRIPAAEQAVKAMMAAMPELASIYPFEAHAPEESIFMYGVSFRSTREQSNALVPTYNDWFRDADKRPAYAYLKRNLQLLQWQRKRSGRWPGHQRWLLKTPDHLHGLEELLAEFPGAQIIQTHRDPVQTIPSICSFIRVLHAPNTARDDSIDIGHAWSAMFAASMIRAMDVRDRHPASFLDIQYRDTVADPRGVAERIFAFVGQPLTEAAWTEMESWRDANKREDRPAHHYTLEEFGLTEAGVKAQFAAYRERFILAEGVRA